MDNTMELTMFERLLQLPLFQGMSTQEVTDIMAHVRLDFAKYQAGDECVMQGDACRRLIYIISGQMTSEYREASGRFTLTEELPNLKVIEPYNMFGMYQKFSRTYSFRSEGSTLSIDKPVLLQQLMVNNIVKLNLLNITSNRYQQTLKLLCEAPDGNVREKIIRFLLAHSTQPKGRKELRIKMTDLADIIHETRINVSIVLNDLEKKGLLTLQRGGFIVKELQDLKKTT